MKEEVKSLWKRCFNDSAAFMDLYFDRRYKEEINIAIREQGQLISALQMIPYPMTFCGEILSTSYISGACTHPEFRQHGAMRRLLRMAHRRMYEEGVGLSLLIPAEEWLVGYYGKSGYTAEFGYTVRRVAVETLSASPAVTVEACNSPSAELYAYFNACMQRRTCCIQHAEDDFALILADLKLGGGKLLVAYREAKLVGMAFVVMEGEALAIKELLADNESASDALLHEAAHLYQVRGVNYLLPASVDPLFLGMARAIDVQQLLTLFARRYPVAALRICVEGDEDIPANNGYYTVAQGDCHRTKREGEAYHTYRIEQVTRLLLEAEHPYMSLMLN